LNSNEPEEPISLLNNICPVKLKIERIPLVFSGRKISTLRMPFEE
jgi:hypothetical protein